MDAQPNPGEDGYLESLQVRLRRAEAVLLAFSSSDGGRVETQVARCVAQSNLHELKQLIADERIKMLEAEEKPNTKLLQLYMDESRKCAKVSLDWSTQQTRAKKYSLGDKLEDLEKQLAEQGTHTAGLRVV